jgi:hypothetical protein
MSASRRVIGGADPVSLRTLLHRHGFAARAGPEAGSGLVLASVSTYDVVFIVN